MDSAEMRALTTHWGGVIREFVAVSTAPLLLRIKELEGAVALLPKPVEWSAALAEIPLPRDGKDADPALIAEMIEAAVEQEIFAPDAVATQIEAAMVLMVAPIAAAQPPAAPPPREKQISIRRDASGSLIANIVGGA